MAFHDSLGHVGLVEMFSAAAACASLLSLSLSNAAAIMYTEAEWAPAYYCCHHTHIIVEKEEEGEEPQWQPTTTSGAALLTHGRYDYCHMIRGHCAPSIHEHCSRMSSVTSLITTQGHHPSCMYALHSIVQHCNLSGHVGLHCPRGSQ